MQQKSGEDHQQHTVSSHQTFVAKSTKMVLLSVMGNRVCTVVLSGIAGDGNQPDPGEIVVGGDRDDVRAADNGCGLS